MAPFETPVVPPVYCKKAMSSEKISCFLNLYPPPIDNAFLKETDEGKENLGTIFFIYLTTKLTKPPFTVPSISPISETITCLILVSEIIFSRL